MEVVRVRTIRLYFCRKYTRIRTKLKRAQTYFFQRKVLFKEMITYFLTLSSSITAAILVDLNDIFTIFASNGTYGNFKFSVFKLFVECVRIIP